MFCASCLCAFFKRRRVLPLHACFPQKYWRIHCFASSPIAFVVLLSVFFAPLIFPSSSSLSPLRLAVKLCGWGGGYPRTLPLVSFLPYSLRSLSYCGGGGTPFHIGPLICPLYPHPTIHRVVDHQQSVTNVMLRVRPVNEMLVRCTLYIMVAKAGGVGG